MVMVVMQIFANWLGLVFSITMFATALLATISILLLPGLIIASLFNRLGYYEEDDED